jgi:hypothetical protein
MSQVETAGFGGVLDPTTGRRVAPPKGKVGEAMTGWTGKNAQTTMHLTQAQKMSAQHGIKCYIYNVSPVFSHQRRVDGFGPFLIPRAPKVGSKILDRETGEARKATAADVAEEYRLSEPIVINHSYARSFDAGEGKRTPYIEYGEDIAQDLVGCSEKYPPDLISQKEEFSKNLKFWGVFITYGKPFEELTSEEQNKLLGEAELYHRARCMEKVNKGDMLYENYKLRGKGGPMEIHRQCALYLGEEFTDRPWVTNRGGSDALTGKIECDMCGSKVKATVAKCPVCQFIIDADKYDKLTRRNKKAEKAE